MMLIVIAVYLIRAKMFRLVNCEAYCIDVVSLLWCLRRSVCLLMMLLLTFLLRDKKCYVDVGPGMFLKYGRNSMQLTAAEHRRRIVSTKSGQL